MVKLIQIERLPARVDGMLFRTTFDENWKLLDQASAADGGAQIALTRSRAHTASTTPPSRFCMQNTSRSC
jgi:hypothetical protein